MVRTGSARTIQVDEGHEFGTAEPGLEAVPTRTITTGTLRSRQSPATLSPHQEAAVMKMSRVQFWVCAACACGAIACGARRGSGDDDCVAEESCECVLDDECGDGVSCEAGVCVGGGDTGVVGDDLGIDITDERGDLPDARGDADTGVPNECGGIEPLVWMGEPAAVGDPCGDCSDGLLICDGDDGLECEGTGEFNECGGCGELTERRGIPCGTCGLTWCEGGEVACVDDLGDECPPPLARSFRLEPSDGDPGDGAENDRFGWTVAALDDGGLLIGATEDDTAEIAGGRVFHYGPSGDGWAFAGALTAPEAQPGDRFGESLAVDVDLAVVGAPGASEAAEEGGVAYVFLRSGGEWSHRQTIVAPVPQAQGGFARSVALDGGWLAIGEESREGEDGVVHLYELVGERWELRTTVSGADDGGDPNRFGWSVALVGTELVVGALADDDLTGRVFAFRFDGDDWLQVALERHPDVTSSANFGYAVALDATGQRLAIGAHLDSAGAPEGGAVYLYDLSDDGWVAGPRIGPTVPVEPARFGSAIAFDGERIYVGAFREPASGNRSGALHVIDRTGDGWSETALLVPGEDAEGSRLGFSVAVTADGRVASGAVQDRSAAEDAGAVYVFSDASGDWEVPTRLVSPRALTEGAFARSVAMEGPVAVVGADESSRFVPRGGAVHVYQRVREGWRPVSVFSSSEPEPLARFGNAVALDGDWLVVGARNADAPDDRSGAAHVFARTDEVTFTEVATLTSPAPVAGGRFGSSVALSNGRILVGEDRERTEPDIAGTAWVFAWDGAAWAFESELPSSTATAAGGYGTAVALDGESAAVSAPLDPEAGGVVERYELVDGVWTSVVTIRSPDGSAAFGTALAFSADELVVGALAGTGVEAASGSTHTFDRETHALRATQIAAGGTTSARFGTALDIEDDLLIVGADRGDVEGSPDGTAVVFGPDESAWVEWDTLTSGDDEPGESFGNAISIDLGRALVGAIEDDGDGRNAGAAYVRE